MFTLQVLAEVSRNPSGGKRSISYTPIAKPRGRVMRICPKLLVLSDLEEETALQEAEALRRGGYTLSSITDPMAVMPDSPDLIVAIPSPGLVAEMAMGLQSRPMAAAILGALWNGIPVYMDFSVLEGCASPALQTLYAGYADRMREFGVKEIFPGHYEAGLVQERTAPKQSAVAAVAGVRRMVITEQDVLAYSGTCWQVPENTIITPLAWDSARKRGLVIEKVHSRRD